MRQKWLLKRGKIHPKIQRQPETDGVENDEKVKEMDFDAYVGRGNYSD